MRIIFSLALFLLFGNLTAQKFEITGKITDPDGSPLESATIYAEKPSDSSLVSYTISEKDGAFVLSGATNAEKVNFTVSYAGFSPHRRSLEVEEEMELGKIEMEIEDNTLDEILVRGTRAPLTLKKDTLEFNASSFKTRPDANLEELMRKLPGVEVDSDGTITVNGRPVSRILVNGEEFFGDDPQIATKNLPKEIIDKIQVTDTKTRSEEFTGKPGDPDNKTINVTIQEDKNTGYFARATAGGGTDDRYELSGIGNYFKDNLRLSVLASSNNINSSGFSYDEVFDAMGRTAGRNAFRGGGGGITKAETAGLNFVNKWNDKYQLNADYFFGRNDTERRTRVQRENLLPDNRYFTNSDDSRNLLNDSHRANARFEIEFDTLIRLSVRPRFNANIGESHRSRLAESLDENGKLINNTDIRENEEMTDANFANNVNFIKRFGSRGAYLQADFSHNHNRQENDNFYYSESRFFENGVEELEVQDQFIDEDQNRDAYSLGVSKRSVLADQFFLDVSYDFSRSNSHNKRYVYDAEAGEGYTNLNEMLSNDFQFTSTRNVPNVGLNYEGDVWRINTDIGLLNTRLETENFMEDINFDNDYNNLYLRARVRYELERSKSLTINYNTDADIPSIHQLQPVANRTNPLNIVQGNPNLRPTYRQNIGINYRNFDFSTRTGIFSRASVRFTDNNVVAVSTVNEDLVRTTTYRNVDGAVNANAGVFYNKQMKNEEKEFRYRLGLSGDYNKTIGFTNAVRYTAERYSVNPSIRLTYAIEELFDINPNYQLTYNSTHYDISSRRNEEFTNHRIGFDATTYWPKNVVWGNDISYNYFGNVSPGFDNSSILWNMSLGYQFFNEDATLRIKVYDLLDENIDTRRMIGDDFIQDTSNLILTRYAMLSFTYKISKFGGRGGPPDQGRRARR